MLFTESKTNHYFPRYWQLLIAFCHVWKKQLDCRNEVSWKAARTPPQWRHNQGLVWYSPHSFRMWVPYKSHADVTGGSSFFAELRNVNQPFSGEGADFGSYLGKYWSVFDAVKRVFFSETCSTLLMWNDFSANYPLLKRGKIGCWMMLNSAVQRYR